MHFAFLFNWAGKPKLTQEWSCSIMSRLGWPAVGIEFYGAVKLLLRTIELLPEQE